MNDGSAEALANSLEAVQDDELFDENGEMAVTGIPFDAKWGLMSKAFDSETDTNWAEAPELTSDLLNEMFQDGEKYRGQAFTLPISRNVGSWVKDPGENPLRLDKITTGWVGNMTWKGNATAIHWIAPFDDIALMDFEGDARLITGRGYFLKNWLYEKASGDPGRVPFFVMDSIEVYTPEPDRSAIVMMWGVLGGTIALCGLVFFLLRQDRRKTAALHAEMVRRRRQRRDLSQTAAAART